MKIDKVLEAHGIGIVKLISPVTPTEPTEPTTPITPKIGIVTDGLLGYWNSKIGVDGSGWENLAPSTRGQYDASIYGATVTGSGMLFNGSTDYVSLPIPTEMRVVTSATFEMRFRLDNGVVDMINQSDGRELIWLDYTALILSGIFDANKYQDQKYVSAPIHYSIYYLTITADLTTSRIDAYLYNPSTGVAHDYYTTTIGTISDGDSVFLSGTIARFSGILDSIRMYNRVLTQEEITQNRTVGTEVGIYEDR